MAEHPDLNRFRQRVTESSEHHRSVIAPRDSEIHKDGMNAREKQRVVEESAAQVRDAMGTA